MSDNITQERPDARSFEERVFARFDAMDQRLNTLEEKVDARLHETRPIWEAVLSRLGTIESRLDSIDGEIKVLNRRVRVLHDDVLRVREDQEELRERVTKLESEPTH